MNIYRKNTQNSVLERYSLVLRAEFNYMAWVTSGTPLIYALLYPKIHKKYPNFGIFTLESASHRSQNTCSIDFQKIYANKTNTVRFPAKKLELQTISNLWGQ